MQKRRRNFVASIFAKRDLDDVCQRVTIQNRADGVSHVEHQYSQPAMNLIRARAASVRCLANAPDRRQWAFDQANDRPEFDLVHGTRERVAAKLSASAFHESGSFELRKNLLKKFDRQFLF